MSNSLATGENRKQSAFTKLEERLLAGLITAMIILACLQIFLRSFFASGLEWAGPLLRYLVLWSGFLGAAMATSRSKHIGLDLLSFIIPWPYQTWVTLITNLFSTIVSGFLTYASILFIRNEMEFGGIQLFAIPTWIWNLIFPLAFGLITLRFFNSVIKDIIKIHTQSFSNKQ